MAALIVVFFLRNGQAICAYDALNTTVEIAISYFLLRNGHVKRCVMLFYFTRGHLNEK